MVYLGATLTQVFTHVHGRSGRVTQRCHNSPDVKRGYRVRVTSCTGSARRIWGILKKSVIWVVLPREKTADFRLHAEALGRCRTRWGGVGQMEKPEQKECVSLSLCWRTFKLKGNKKFHTWTKKSSVFFVFRDSYVIYIYTFPVHFAYPYLAM